MSERNMRKTTVGMVVSNKMDKTIVVAVEDSYRHPLYNKIIKRTVKRKAHDEENVCAFAVIGASVAENFGVEMPEGTIGKSILDRLK